MPSESAAKDTILCGCQRMPELRLSNVFQHARHQLGLSPNWDRLSQLLAMPTFSQFRPGKRPTLRSDPKA